MSISDTQNFINNKEIVDRIISFVDFQKTKLVIEIGPGKGIITDALIKNAEKIIAIEMDVKLYTTLKQKYIHQNNITLINEDFLKLPLPDREFSIVSNIPFNITANIIRKITEKKSKLSSAYLIVQKEAAIKFIGAPYAHFPLLSNFLKINYQIESLIDIDRRNYSPTPQFDTILLLIKKRDSPVIINE